MSGVAGVLNSRGYLIASWLLLAAVAAAAVWSLLVGRSFDALVLAGFIALALAFISVRDKLPRIFTFLFVVAGAVNTAGYVFKLWQTPWWFDEVVHFYTSFAGMAAIGWVLLARTRANADGALRFTLAVAAVGLVIGVLWEIFEWIIGIIDGRTDTIIDLAMDTAGAIAAGLFCAWAAKEARGRSPYGREATAVPAG